MFGKNKTSEDFCFSLFSGGAQYKFYEKLDNTDLKTLIDPGKFCPSITTLNKKYYYWLKRIRYIDDAYTSKDLGVYRHYFYLIENKPDFDNILWPADIVDISRPILDMEGKALTVSRHHDARDDSNKIDVSNYGLIFPYFNDLSEFDLTARNIVDYYKNSRGPENERLTYKNPVIRKMIIEIVNALKGLYDSGYIYYDISLPRFIIDNTGPESCIFLDFSNLIYGRNEFEKEEMFLIEEPKEIEADFAEPFFMDHDEIIIADEHAFLFSLCSLMFYLMFGRNAYAGSSQVEDESSLLQHYRIAKERLKNPYFVFDKDEANNINKLGLLASDNALIDLFNEAPAELKEFFIETLSYENATRTNAYSFAPSLDDWLNCFKAYGWISESKKTRIVLPEN